MVGEDIASFHPTYDGEQCKQRPIKRRKESNGPVPGAGGDAVAVGDTAISDTGKG